MYIFYISLFYVRITTGKYVSSEFVSLKFKLLKQPYECKTRLFRIRVSENVLFEWNLVKEGVRESENQNF